MRVSVASAVVIHACDLLEEAARDNFISQANSTVKVVCFVKEISFRKTNSLKQECHFPNSRL